MIKYQIMIRNNVAYYEEYNSTIKNKEVDILRYNIKMIP